MAEKSAKIIPLSRKQLAFLQTPQKRKALIAGRGFGKTHVMGHHEHALFRNLPTGKGLMVAPTYYQLLTKTCPELESVWKLYNIHEYNEHTKQGQWVFGRKPPKHFALPYKAPKNPEYCYFFINGHVKELGSLEVKDRFRGGSFDSLSGDESAMFKKDVWNKIFVASVRGRTTGPGKFDPRRNYMHQSIAHFTSAPWDPNGRWVFEWRDLAKENPDLYLFMSGTTHDNVGILGQEYIENLRQVLSPMEWFVEVENGELDRPIGGGYYPSFSEEKHACLDVFEYEFGDGLRKVTRDTFIKQDGALLLSMDFNNKFTSMVVAQQTQLNNAQELRFIDNLWEVPDPLKDKSELLLIDRLVDKFCQKYALHQVKYVEVYGDATAHNQRLGTDAIFVQVKNRFLHNGWACAIKAGNKLPEHRPRQLLINNILRRPEPKYPIVRFHAHNCKAVMMSMQHAEITADFKKDKSSERRNIPQEMATHLSDCVDYLICALYSRLGNFGTFSTLSSFNF